MNLEKPASPVKLVKHKVITDDYKGNDTKVQNEVIAQTITDETAKRLKLARLFPKQEIKENSDYYTYFRQNINLDEAIKKGLLGRSQRHSFGRKLARAEHQKTCNRHYLY